LATSIANWVDITARKSFHRRDTNQLHALVMYVCRLIQHLCMQFHMLDMPKQFDRFGTDMNAAFFSIYQLQPGHCFDTCKVPTHGGVVDTNSFRRSV
jgi:hypothetical protein